MKEKTTKESHPVGMVEIKVIKRWNIMIVDIINIGMVDRLFQSSLWDEYRIAPCIPTNKIGGLISIVRQRT